MAGLPGDVVENPTLSIGAQEAALTIAAEAAERRDAGRHVAGALTHYPPSSHACYTPAAHDAAGASNLYLGQTGADAVDGYILDPGATNDKVGHRNWILHPPLTEIGIGDVPMPSPYFSTNALNVISGDSFGPQPEMRRADGGVAWPSAGYFPAELVVPRWSFSLRGADFTNAEVDVRVGGQPVGTVVEHQGAGPGAPFPTIVWNLTEPIAETLPVDLPVEISVSNVVADGQTRTVSYVVTVIGATAGPAGPSTGSYDDLEEATFFVAAAYEDFLGRQPTIEELVATAADLAAGGSVPEFLESLVTSDEWTGHVVEQMYQDTLGRGSDSAGRDYWIDRLQSDTTVAEVAGSFYGSPEYVNRLGGDHGVWIDDLYVRLLDRQPDAAGRAFWVDDAAAGGTGAVAYRLYQSEESRRARVIGLYRELLGRDPDEAGLAYWAEVLLSGDDLALATHLAASDEYFERSAP